jgi:hypothetical protein
MTPTVPRLRQFFSTPRLRTRSATAVTIAAVSVFAAPLACTHTIEITAPPVDGPSGTPAGGLAPSPDTAPPADAPTPPGLDDDAASTLDWNGEWEWLAPKTTSYAFRAAWAAAPDDLWLVANEGVVVRWDGKSQARVVYRGPSDGSLKAIAGRGPNDVWVAGSNHVAHWDGEHWSHQSHWLGRLDVRTLVVVSDTLVALTEDGRLFNQNSVSGSTWDDGVYDVTPADRGGAYVLTDRGVDWITYDSTRRRSDRKSVVSFGTKLDPNVWKHGRLFGNTPERFRYLFEYDPFPGASGTYFAVNDAPPPAMPRRRIYLPRPTPDHRYGTFVVRTDDEHAFIQVGRSAPMIYDGSELTPIEENEANRRIRGAFRRAGGGLGVVGTGGYVAEVRRDDETQRVVYRELSTPFDIVTQHFAVASDDSAWAAGMRGPEGAKTPLFGLWDDVRGLIWRTTPAELPVRALLPVARNDVWMLLGGTLPWPQAKLVAHWDGQQFDKLRPVEKDIPMSDAAAESGGTFFLVSEQGELFHADRDGQLHSVGRASDEHGGERCENEDQWNGWSVHALSGKRAFVVGPRCSISYFDGSAFLPLPPFRPTRGASDGKGRIRLWARDPKNVFVLQSYNGLYSWDGTRWTAVVRSTEILEGLWGADTTNVWFVEHSTSREAWDFNRPGHAGSMLWRWDGKVARPVEPAGPHLLTGGTTSAWLFSTPNGASLRRLRATPRSPRPR